MCGHSTGYSPFQLNDFKNALVTQLAHCFVSETIDSPGDKWCIIYLSPKNYSLYQLFKEWPYYISTKVCVLSNDHNNFAGEKIKMAKHGKTGI